MAQTSFMTTFTDTEVRELFDALCEARQEWAHWMRVAVVEQNKKHPERKTYRDDKSFDRVTRTIEKYDNLLNS